MSNNNNFARQYAEAERIVRESEAENEEINNLNLGNINEDYLAAMRVVNEANKKMNNFRSGQAGMTNNNAMKEALRMSLPTNTRENNAMKNAIQMSLATNTRVNNKNSGNNQRFKPRPGILTANEAREVTRYIGAGENSNSILRRVKPLFPSMTLAKINAYLGRNRTSGGKSRKVKKSRKTRKNSK